MQKTVKFHNISRMVQYTAYLLPEDVRQELIAKFPPLYPNILADHITHQFGVTGFGGLCHAKAIEITGVADNGDGLQALVIKVDGKQFKPDGLPYHITWSLDPAKHSPVDSNRLVANALAGTDAGIKLETIDPPLKINAPAVHIHERDRNNRIIRYLPPSAPDKKGAPKPPRP